ncbi:MAG: undecaprenyl-phosphate glucose phosphotransferase [Pseudomonadota bacterium]|nr:undecaprenyl-phosphate glucose phosphotransferase [Pseudomonadota bacterium]
MLAPGSRADGAVVFLSGAVAVLTAGFLYERRSYSALTLFERKLRLDTLALALLQAFGVLLLVRAAMLAAEQAGFPAFSPHGADWAGRDAWLFAFASASLLGLVGVRLAWLRMSPRLLAPHRVVVVGANELSQDLLRRLQASENLDVQGVVHDLSETPGPTFADLPVLGSVPTLLEMIRRGEVDVVIVALPWSAAARIRALVAEIAAAPVDLFVAPDLPGCALPARPVSLPADVPLLHASDRPLSAAQTVLKRAQDLILASILVLLAAPVMIAIAVAVKMTSSGPVFFRQRRLGFNNRVIEVLKFRSMYTHLTDRDACRQTSRNDKRVTSFGGLLRRTSLDELPQLLNVLKGDMSIVGPRPHALQTTAGGVPLEEAVPEYTSRHRVKPGITGWAQVNGCRGEIDSVEKIVKRVDYDLEYIRNWSLALDLRIIWRTTLLILVDPHAY